MKLDEIINVDPNILGGTPVFHGTRVPIRTLFEHLEGGIGLEEFLDDFPSVRRELAIALLEYFNQLVEKDSLDRLREIAA